MNFNEDQLIGKEKILKFLKNKEKYFLLTGPAGSGKTTLIVDCLKDLKKRIAFSATTNKAVSVLQLLSPLKNKNVNYVTIHKLLNIKRQIDEHGQAQFSYMDMGLGSNLFKQIMYYDIVVIDECSMINRTLANYLDNIINTIKTKIIFVGDINQLPPINENKSKIFSKLISCHHLSKIERFKNDIVKYSNSIINRTKVKYNELGTEIKFCKTINDWLDTYNIEDSIALAYTNNRTKYINNYIREKMFPGIKDKYTINEKIVCTNFYYSENIKCFSSEMFIITDIKNSDHIFTKLPLESILNLKLDMKQPFQTTDKKRKEGEDTCPICYDDEIDIMTQTKCGHLFCKTCIKMWLNNHKCCPMCRCDLIDNNNKIIIKDNKELSDIINDLIAYTINLNIKVQYLYVKNNDKCGEIMIVDPVDEKKYSEIYLYIQEKLRYFKDIINKKTFAGDKFNKVILQKIWEFFYVHYIDIFAKIDYGYCITIHKSQGSTYYNVHLDLKDIVSYNKTDTKECVYTGITRSSNELYILK